MAVYMSMHIKDKTIAMVPVRGYVNSVNYSVESIRWLEFIAASEGLNIKHALNGHGEKKIAGIYVDGYCKETNTIYQFHVSFLNNFIFA